MGQTTHHICSRNSENCIKSCAIFTLNHDSLSFMEPGINKHFINTNIIELYNVQFYRITNSSVSNEKILSESITTPWCLRGHNREVFYVTTYESSNLRFDITALKCLVCGSPPGHLECSTLAKAK